MGSGSAGAPPLTSPAGGVSAGASRGAFDLVGLHSGAMNRNSGIGLTSLGIVLAVVGAILRIAISVHSSGFNIHKVGDVLLVVGILLVIASLFGMARARSRSATRV
jgi:hypothetical protein